MASHGDDQHARAEEDESAGFKGWSACARVMRDYDENLVKRWSEEIDTLLVFVSPPFISLHNSRLMHHFLEGRPFLRSPHNIHNRDVYAASRGSRRLVPPRPS
jgi:hypothetical protein